MATNTWQKLTRADLRGFDDAATSVVLEAMDRGGIGRLSSNGHLLIRNSAGQTMAVTRDSTKSREVVRVNLRKLFPEGSTPASELEPVQPLTAEQRDRLALPAQPAGQPDSDLTGEDYPLTPCPAKGCDREFATEGALYAHIRDGHARCQEDDCTYVGSTGGALAGHMNLVHRGHKPWEARRAPKAKVNGHERQHRVAAVATDTDTVAEIRRVLGADPRVAKLEAKVAELTGQLAAATKHSDELEARLTLLREALDV